MKYIVQANTFSILLTEQRKYKTKEEVIEAVKILLNNFHLIDNIIIKETK